MQRKCRMCDVLQVTQKPIEELKAEIRRIVKKFSEKSIFMDMALNEKAIDEFRDFANGCPACMLAAIRQSDESINFDFKKECEDFWADINERNYQEESYY